MTNIIKGNPEYDITIDDNTVNALFEDAEETKKWEEVKRFCQNGDLKIRLIKVKYYDTAYKKWRYSWKVSIYAGNHSLACVKQNKYLM